MSDPARRLLLELAGWVASGVAMTLLMGWLTRDRLRPRRADQPLRLVNPPSVLILGLVVSLFFITLFLLSSVFYRNETSTWWVAAIFLTFAAGGLWMVLSWAVERVDVSPARIVRRTALGTRQSVQWADIERVTWASGMKWFRIQGEDGSCVRVSASLTALPEFAQAVLRLARSAQMDEHTREVLEATARGDLPALS